MSKENAAIWYKTDALWWYVVVRLTFETLRSFSLATKRITDLLCYVLSELYL